MIATGHSTRDAAALMIIFALIWPGVGFANHDHIPDPAPRSTSIRLPAGLRLERNTVTVSGLSSGGFFAHQFHIAHSALVAGIGIIAGGPYGCVEQIPNPYWPYVYLDRLSAALTACTHYASERFWGLRAAGPRAENSKILINDAYRQGVIDDPRYLEGDRIWLFRGDRDMIVPKAVSGALAELYQALGVRRDRLQIEPNDPGRPANHGMPVETFPSESRFPKRDCAEHQLPFVIECDRDAAGLLLHHLYKEGFERTPADPHTAGTLVAFDQTEFLGQSATAAGLSGVGYLYIPAACLGDACRLHVAFHGCRQNVDAQGANRVHDDFVRDAGYNRWAAANRIVVLYPQTTESAVNPNRCWDFWGYSGVEYRTQHGLQIRAVRRMVDRMLGPIN